MTFNKGEAAAELHISVSTLNRRLAAGIYRGTKLGTRKSSPWAFTYADLGLQEPEAPAPAVVAAPVPAIVPDTREPDASPRPLSAGERDAEFAARYKAGMQGDSNGNLVDGTNPNFPSKGLQSLIGNPEPDHGPPAETQGHMSPALLSDHHYDGTKIEGPVRMSCVPHFVNVDFNQSDGVTKEGLPLAKGLDQKTYDAMMVQWRKDGGGRSQSEMEQAIRRARQAIGASFPR